MLHFMDNFIRFDSLNKLAPRWLIAALAKANLNPTLQNLQFFALLGLANWKHSTLPQRYIHFCPKDLLYPRSSFY